MFNLIKVAKETMHKCELLKIPYNVGVITVPTPNRRGKAIFTPKSVLMKCNNETGGL